MWRQRRPAGAEMLFVVGFDGFDEQQSIAAGILMPEDRESWLGALSDLQQQAPAHEPGRRWAEAVARPLSQVLARAVLPALPPSPRSGPGRRS